MIKFESHDYPQFWRLVIKISWGDCKSFLASIA